jgi:large subunit ribosomal protein L31e
MAPKKGKADKKDKAAPEPKALEATINLHKRLHGVSFKNRAPRAVREIKAFAKALMRTEDVRIDSELNKAVWAKGIRNVPFRVRVRMERRRAEEEDGTGMVTHVQYVEMEPREMKGETTKKVELKDE